MRLQIEDFIASAIKNLDAVIPASKSASGILLKGRKDSGQARNDIMTLSKIRPLNRRSTELKIANCRFKIAHCVIIISSIFLLLTLFASVSFAEEKWQGVDDSVVNKIAKEHGREAWRPFINTDQGDLLLFVFLIAGTIGGFAAGYYWRMLTENKTERNKKS